MTMLVAHVYGINLTPLAAKITDKLSGAEIYSYDFSDHDLGILEQDGWEELINCYSLGEGSDGRGGIAWIGVDIPETDQGYVVTDQIKVEAEQVLLRCPKALLDVIKAVNGGNLPAVEFSFLTGYG